MTICHPPGAPETVYTPDELTAIRGEADTLVKLNRAVALAWASLATLTADRIGVCPVTVRPCAISCSPAGTWTEAPAGGLSSVLAGRSSFQPHLNAQGQWVNGCGCVRDCGCTALSEVRLPAPVGQIVEVWLNGAVVDPATYRVDGGAFLVSLDPDRPWPTSQNLLQDAHGPDAFSVTYYRGAGPDDLILHSVGLLAKEFYKDAIGQKCALPKGVRAVNRQGISYEIQTNMFDEGKTGIQEVDMLISRLNPFHLKVRPIVMSPDSRRSRVY